MIALKDLGFTLNQVQAILAESVSAAELRGMLRLRQAEIRSQIESETARLARVEARLMTIEDEGSSGTDGVVCKQLPAVRLAELTGIATGFEPAAITPVIQPLYSALWQQLARAGVGATGPGLAYYEDAPSGDGVIVHAAVPVRADGAGAGFAIADLPGVDRAATIIHHGSMDDVLVTGQALARWIDANGYRSAGYLREVTLEWSPDPEHWVTELQQAIYAP